MIVTVLSPLLSTPLSLLDSHLNVWAATLTLPGSRAVTLTADRLEHIQAEDLYIGEGSVTITQGTLRLTADRARFNAKSGQLQATGRVEFSDGEHRLRTEQMTLDLAGERARVTNAEIFISREQYTITGETIERVSPTQYRIEHATFTTCEVQARCRPVWQFRARRVRLHLNDQLTAQHVVLFLKGVPVAYLPYLIVPVKERQTGLLIPKIGTNTQEGFKIEQPFFWAITPSQDATTTLDYRSEKGTGGSLEYRYLLGEGAGGVARIAYFRDRQLQQDRIETRYHHTQWISQALQGRADISYVSAPTLLRELSESTADRIRRSIESNVFVTGRWTKHHLLVLGRYVQDLELPNDLTIQRLPEAGYSLMDLRLGRLPLFVTFDAAAVNFYQEKVRPTVRVDLFPRAVARLRLHRGLTLTPRIGYRETYYTRQAASLDPTWRGVPVLGMGAESRLTARLAAQLTHVVEPSVLYEYVPEVDQQALRQFDEVDQLPAKQLITYALANRLRVKGDDLLTVRLTQSYRMKTATTSDARVEAVLQPWRPLAIEVDTFYNPADRRFTSVNADLRVTHDAVTLSVGRRETPTGRIPQKGDVFNPLSLGEDLTIPATIQFVTSAATVRFGQGLTVSARTYYDDQAQAMREAAYTMTLMRQCWGATLSYLHFPEKDQVSILFTLKGVGGIGP